MVEFALAKRSNFCAKKREREREKLDLESREKNVSEEEQKTSVTQHSVTIIVEA